MDDKNQKGPQDRSRINVNEDYEVQYWCQKLGVSPQELKDAVAAAGVSAEAVKTYLSGKPRN